MRVLGLNTMENSSACLVCDGRIVAAAEEERFTRKKHQEGVPLRALNYCLQEGCVDLTDIDIVALGWQPWRILRRTTSVLWHAACAPRRFVRKAMRGAGQVAGDEWWRMITLPYRLPRLLDVERRACRYRFLYLDHHYCHAASAFYPSPYTDAAILTLDGAGESACITLSRGAATRISTLQSILLPHSLGHLYSAVTGFLGFRMCSGEGKVMGLAAYGRNRYQQAFERMVTLHENGGLKIDFNWLDYHLALAGVFSPSSIELFGKPRDAAEPLESRHEDVARSAQDMLERSALHIAEHLYRNTRIDALCLAGGWLSMLK